MKKYTLTAAGLAALLSVTWSTLMSHEASSEAAPHLYEDPRAWELAAAIRSRDVKLVKKLVADGVRVDREPTKRGGHVHGTYPVCVAAGAGNLEILTFLLDAGGSPHSTHSSGESALYVATRAGHFHLATLLLERGADPNGSGLLMQYPLDVVIAEIERYREFEQLLRSKGGKMFQDEPNAAEATPGTPASTESSPSAGRKKKIENKPHSEGSESP